MTISYATPPQYPEFYASTPFASTLLSYIAVNANGARDVLRNWVPRQTSGLNYSGMGGPAPFVVANQFPCNASGDSLYANDYALRSPPGGRPLMMPYSSGFVASTHPYATTFCVFKVEDIIGPNNPVLSTSAGFVPFFSVTNGCMLSGGQSNTPNTMYGAYWTSAGIYMGMMCQGQFTPNVTSGGLLWLTNTPIQIGHWYFGAWSTSDYSSTPANVSLSQALRFFLHDLTTNTRISPNGYIAIPGTVTTTLGSPTVTGSGTAFSTYLVTGNLVQFSADITNTQYKISTVNSATSITLTTNIAAAAVGAGQNILGANQIFSSTNGTSISKSQWTNGWSPNWQGSNIDISIFPGRRYGQSQAMCQIHMLGIDNAFWDETGYWSAIPAGFSSIDPFTYLQNPSNGGIYEPITSSYTTGSTTVLCNGSSGQNSAIWSGHTTTYPYITSSSDSPNGVPTGITVVANGDVAIAAQNNVSITMAVTRPQAAPNAPSGSWVWKMYASTTRENGTGGTPVATFTGALPTLSAFTWSPPSSAVWFIIITAFDGTNTYTYAETPVCLNPYPDIWAAFGGNSINTGTGSDPAVWFGQACYALGANAVVLNMAIDSTTGAAWTPTAASDASSLIAPVWWYTTALTGTVTVTTGSPTVTSATNYTGLLSVGQYVVFSGDATQTQYKISAVGSSSGFTLNSNAAAAANGSGQTVYVAPTTLGILEARIANELVYAPAGTKFDVFLQLLGNDTVLSSSSNYSAIASSLLGTGNVGRVIFQATPWQMVGHSIIQNASAMSDSLVYQTAIANGTTIFSIGNSIAFRSGNLQCDNAGSHPDIFVATIDATNAANEYIHSILNPLNYPGKTGIGTGGQF